MKQTIRSKEKIENRRKGLVFSGDEYEEISVNDNAGFFISRLYRSGKCLEETLHAFGRHTGTETFYMRESKYSIASTFKEGFTHGIHVHFNQKPKTTKEKMKDAWKRFF